MERAFTILALSCLSACAHIRSIAYVAQPGQIADPTAEIKALISTTVGDDCVATPIFTQTTLAVQQVCAHGNIGTGVVRFDQVGSIEIQQAGVWYGVLLKHVGGAEDFYWGSQRLIDAERMVDALTALSNAATQTKT